MGACNNAQLDAADVARLAKLKQQPIFNITNDFQQSPVVPKTETYINKVQASAGVVAAAR